jgi:serine/threonine-protein kinase HipA
VLVTAITEDDDSASLALVFEVAGYSELSTTSAREIAAEGAAVVSTWRAQAKRRGISRQEVDRMASAFEHRDLDTARGR